MLRPKINYWLEKEMIKRYTAIILLTITFFFGSGFFSGVNREDKDFSSVLNKAKDHYNVGNYSKAVEILSYFNKVDDQNLYKKRSYFILGKSYLSLGNYTEALKSFINAETSFEQLKEYAIYYQGMVYFQQKKYNEARDYFYRVFKEYPNSIVSGKAYLMIGEGLFWQESLKKAEVIFKELLTSSSNKEVIASSEYFLAKIKEDLGNTKEAYEDYKKLLNDYPDNFYARQVIEKFKDKISILNLDADTILIFSNSFYKEGKYKDAKEFYEMIIKDYSNTDAYGDAIFMLGMCEYNLKEYGKAINHLKNFIQNFKNNEQRCEGLYWLGRAYRANGNRQEFISIFMNLRDKYPKTSWAPRALYFLGNYYLDSGSPKAALDVYKEMMTSYKGHYLVDDVIWNGGWYRYKKGDYDGAINYWNNIFKYAPYGDISAKCIYWMGKIKEKTGDTEGAYKSYKIIYSDYYYSYYGFRVYERFKKSWNLKYRQIDKQMSFMDVIDNNLSQIIDKFREMVYAYEVKDALLEINNKINNSKDQELNKKLKIVLGYLYFESQDYKTAIECAEDYFRQDYKNYKDTDIPFEVWRLYYPLGYKDEVISWAGKRNLDPYFVMGLIREESRFQASVRSWASAYGLMQIIPSTGRSIARSLGLDDFQISDLFIPDINIQMGTYYIGNLIKIFSGNKYLACAGYNAGPGAAKGWWNSFGGKDMDYLIESIPYSETKEYVKKVMGSYWVYLNLYRDDEL